MLLNIEIIPIAYQGRSSTCLKASTSTADNIIRHLVRFDEDVQIRALGCARCIGSCVHLTHFVLIVMDRALENIIC